ncbi:hypothetical protein PTKIN_Ptkin16aG0548200 [Pterospermum kingtungense]
MFSCRNDDSPNSCSLILFLIIVFCLSFSVMILFSLTLSLLFFLSNQEIQCYVSKTFGHICCVNFVDTSGREVLVTDVANWVILVWSRGVTKETTDNGSPSLCYKCGEGRHFARECPAVTASSSLCYECGGIGLFARECSSDKVGKRNRELCTPNVRPRKENKEFLGYKSAPHGHGKSPKRKIIQFEEKGFSTPRKAKQRGGWYTEDPGDFSHGKS